MGYRERDYVRVMRLLSITLRLYRCRKGFTLLELIVVLFIIGLICGFSTVFVAKGLPSAKLNATARELSATIRHARALALMNCEAQRIVVDVEARQYGIEGHPRKSIPADVIMKTADPVSGEATAENRSIRFAPDGSYEGASVWLANKTLTVRIDTDPVVGSTVAKTVSGSEVLQRYRSER
jgi:general secretion pathway protein H